MNWEPLRRNDLTYLTWGCWAYCPYRFHIPKPIYMENYPSEIGTRSSKWMVSIQAGPGAFADVANVELEEPQAPQSQGWFCCAAPWALRNARGAGWGDVWFLSIGSCYFFWWVVHLLYSNLSICTRCCLLLWVMFADYILYTLSHIFTMGYCTWNWNPEELNWLYMTI